jgi:hypothetical protein
MVDILMTGTMMIEGWLLSRNISARRGRKD